MLAPRSNTVKEWLRIFWIAGKSPQNGTFFGCFQRGALPHALAVLQ
jgi:hypothetical protein